MTNEKTANPWNAQLTFDSHLNWRFSLLSKKIEVKSDKTFLFEAMDGRKDQSRVDGNSLKTIYFWINESKCGP